MNLQLLKRLLSWLGELRYVYLAVLYVLLGIALIYCFGATERSIRFVGGGLQVLGIGTVVWGILKTRKYFGHSSVLDITLSWFRRCPLFHQGITLEPGGITAKASLSGARLTSVFTPTPNAPLEKRLETIEKGIETIQNRAGDIENQLDKELRTTHDKIEVETSARSKGDQETMKAVETASTSGIYISAIGSLWLFVGAILSTASQELSLWLG